ncbi:cytochrome b/b6 domain-containing protein [Phenylobacterium sp. J426]|uniref:cytochrome b/b6 domain-containing protein n=1 Tax=Phenylobacterium sp. J426 TaxID=2898439 RepID=UPI002150F688|nr:cytochrome b/b6 domain-containing protein [Phenylobacterium sp. J426]MCR5874523.1 cytochrome b/b6 domain-containing protein [Phenylobacterium sp. J426]
MAIYRHPILVRLTHWITALSLGLLLFSGLQILNAHPALYWGEVSRFDRAFIAFTPDAEGRVFPPWLTLPAAADLGAGRQWHFAAAWVLVGSLAVYLIYNLLVGRLRRELLPGRAELAGVGRSVLDHMRLKFDHGARRYNVLQKLAYLVIGVVILPAMVLTGLAMSPSLDALLPLSEMFGGRQSARTLHFFGAASLVAFLLAHVAMVVAAGPINEMRSILTGWFVVRLEEKAP